MNTEQTKKKSFMVYAIRCKSTGKMYIGVTCDLMLRFAAHMNELKNGTKGHYTNLGSQTWQADFDKFGEESFEFFIIEKNLPFDERLQRESYYINLYGTVNPEIGYNSTVSARFYEKPYSFNPYTGKEDGIIDTYKKRIELLVKQNAELRDKLDKQTERIINFVSEITKFN